MIDVVSLILRKLITHEVDVVTIKQCFASADCLMPSIESDPFYGGVRGDESESDEEEGDQKMCYKEESEGESYAEEGSESDRSFRADPEGHSDAQDRPDLDVRGYESETEGDSSGEKETGSVGVGYIQRRSTDAQPLGGRARKVCR